MDSERMMFDIRANAKDAMAQEFADRVARRAEELRRTIAPPGSIPNIPPLLEEKRIKHSIPDGAFKIQPVYDYIFVYQISAEISEDGAYGDTLIQVPDVTKTINRQENPVGILLSGGLTALDNLWSHGIEIGHTVQFCQLAPYRLPIEVRHGRHEYVMLLRSGLIRGSYEQREDIAAGKLKIGALAIKDANGEVYHRHVFMDSDGKFRRPLDVPIYEDY